MMIGVTGMMPFVASGIGSAAVSGTGGGLIGASEWYEVVER